MFAGNFNYHQILFALDTFNHDNEKIGYLEKISDELTRIVDCFESPKSLPLNMYASKNLSITDNNPELQGFIKKQFDLVTSNPYDKRYPSESELKSLLKSETLKYKKLLMIVNKDLEELIGKIEPQNYIVSEPVNENNFIFPQKSTPNFISYLLINTNRMIIWEKSIGELIDLIKIIIVLELYPDIDENGIINLICKRFVNNNKELFSTRQVDKTYNMLQNTFWLNSRGCTPKFYH
ncbi:MAG: hypothetical protein KKF62_16315 [Bacteroidetes bacterium]|nr:hypothetical protein [Bacteroidota bacterium]MBU1113690.1 hypothetical protein [Bacteroidota bacterium]MBU1799091.1 hypothetical protein [Bacteroidota bacterium]